MLIQTLTKFVQSRWYWLVVIIAGFSLEAVALFYQHVLGEPPCVLCIQSRVWVMVGILFAIVGLIGSKITALRFIAQLGLLASLSMLLSKSWTTLLVERGLYDGNCGMDPGFPAWFALDSWFPNLFQVWTMCGFTPNFLFGLTMGEGLFYGSIALIIIALAALALMVIGQLKKV